MLTIGNQTTHQIRCGAREGPVFATAAGAVIMRRQRGGTQGRITERNTVSLTLEPGSVRPLAPLALGTPRGRHLVALDIDGTTLHHDGTLSDEVYSAVRDTVAAGHDVVIATGRSLLEAWPVIDALGLRSGYAVCSNGAVTLRLDSRERRGYRIVDQVTFDPRPALELLRHAWPGAVFAVERVGVGFDISASFPDGDLSGRLRVSTWEELTAAPTTRLTFYSPDAHVEEFAHAVERIGLHGVNYAVGFTAWLDVAPAGVSKASALEGVRSRLRIPAERTVAVGDQRNDLEMLDWAGCGVAMGNAPVEVQDVADLVTGDVLDDGLLAVLNGLPAAD